jgi:uncharacterized RmlC-like cupin family protein
MRPLHVVVAAILVVTACADDDAPRAGGTARLAEASDAPATPRQATLPGKGGIEFYPAAALSRIGDELAKGATTARTVGAHQNFHYVEARRAASGVPEVHDRWTDVTIVQAGRATLLSGGRVEGGRDATPGEYRGGTIVNGDARAIAPGDLFIIPAGVPHQFQLARGDSVRYLTIKVLRPER